MRLQIIVGARFNQNAIHKNISLGLFNCGDRKIISYGRFSCKCPIPTAPVCIRQKANELNICLFDEYFVFLQQSL